MTVLTNSVDFSNRFMLHKSTLTCFRKRRSSCDSEASKELVDAEKSVTDGREGMAKYVPGFQASFQNCDFCFISSCAHFFLLCSATGNLSLFIYQY